MTKDSEYWIDSWSARRRQMIENYLSVKPTTNKINVDLYRTLALHYGRLIRMLKRGAA